jgi:hypothetical protein
VTRSATAARWGLLFSALFAAALAQPTNEQSDDERGQQECDDRAHADEHIGQNNSGAVLDGHGARRRSSSNASVRSVERIASQVHSLPRERWAKNRPPKGKGGQSRS